MTSWFPLAFISRGLIAATLSVCARYVTGQFGTSSRVDLIQEALQTLTMAGH